MAGKEKAPAAAGGTHLARHNEKKVVLCDLRVPVPVCALHHLEQLCVAHGLAQLLCHALEVAQVDAALAVHVKEVKHLVNVLPRVRVPHLCRQHVKEGVKVNLVVARNVADHAVHGGVLGLKAQALHGSLELLGVNLA